MKKMLKNIGLKRRNFHFHFVPQKSINLKSNLSIEASHLISQSQQSNIVFKSIFNTEL